MPDSLDKINKRHAAYLDSMLDTFEAELRVIVNKAQAMLAGLLQKKLDIKDGNITSAPANIRLLRFLDDRFMEFLDEAGYGHLLKAFTSEFAGQQVFLQDTLDYLGLPHPGFTATDLKALSVMKLNAVTSLELVAETAARTATQNAMFSLGALKFSDLVETVGEKLGASIGRARSVADTMQVGFYRMMTDVTFRKIEADLPEEEQRYAYSGPDDRLTRPFCKRLVESKKTYSREQIEKMDNGQLPNPMISAGGWNCRHTWLLAGKLKPQESA